MSSPISKAQKGAFDLFLIGLHQRLSHRTRVEILADQISRLIREHAPVGGPVRCLDVGCGDMVIAEKVQEKSPSVLMKCADIYPVPERLSGDPRWAKYVPFDGARLPFEDGEFDFAIFCDVLHHTSDESQRALFREASRVAKFLIIKDHFQYGLYSRTIMRMMDRFGNSAYGVDVPSNYFSVPSFGQLCRDTGLEAVQWVRGLTLYAHLPFLYLIVSRNWEFLAVLRRGADARGVAAEAPSTKQPGGKS